MFHFDSISLIAEQRHKELLKEAEKYRMLKAAFKDTPAKTNIGTKLLAFVGVQLASLGHSLESRYGSQTEPRTSLNPQTNPGGCT